MWLEILGIHRTYFGHADALRLERVFSMECMMCGDFASAELHFERLNLFVPYLLTTK